MKYFLLFFAVALTACSSNTNTIVVPVNYFSINFNGTTYNETSDASHPISASVTTSTDKFFGGKISIASVSANTKNVVFGCLGQKNDVTSPTGTFTMGIRDSTDTTRAPYVFTDKGNGYTQYTMDTLGSIYISQADARTITGSIKMNLYHYNTATSSMDVFPATASFTYNLYYGTH
jgi:hypothetical protein